MMRIWPRIICSLLLITFAAELVAGDPAKLLRARRDKQEKIEQEASDKLAATSFTNASTLEQRKYIDVNTIAELNNELPDEYLLGPGDVVEVTVWDQEEVSGTHV